MSNLSLVPSSPTDTATVTLVERNGVPCMTLSQVAELFGKEKYNVCKALKELDASLLKDVEFVEDSRCYVTEAYIPERTSLMLVTGFTGEKAAQIRLACVDAFIAFRELRAKAASNPLALAMADFDNNPMAAYAAIEAAVAHSKSETLKRITAEKQLASANSRLAGKTALAVENTALRERIGEATFWKSLKAVLKTHPELRDRNPSSLGKALTKLSKELGRLVRKVEDSQYGTVNTYHTAVIEEFLRREEVRCQ